MRPKLFHENLENYRQLLHRIDTLCQDITSTFAREISCKAGCSGCCRHLTLCAVEAASIREAISTLPADVRQILAERKEWPESSPCPLLIDDCCAVYTSRPVICRTHGLPLLLETAEGKRLDCCPKNFSCTETLPGSAVINLETLNSALIAINAIFIKNSVETLTEASERISIAAIIRIAEDPNDD